MRSRKSETHKLSACYAAVSILVLVSAMLPSSTVAQTLLNAPDLIKPSDYPAGSMSRGEEGISAFELTLKNGRPAYCKITSSAGFRELDEATCRLATERSLFDLSTLPKGNWSTYSNRVKWNIIATEPRANFGNLKASQSVSRTDPNKIRCQYSDGVVSFVSAGYPCIQYRPYELLTKNQLCKDMKKSRKTASPNYSFYLAELSTRGLTEKQCAVQWGKILLAVGAVAVVAAAVSDGGGRSYGTSRTEDVTFRWDEQPGDYGVGRRWVCRGEQTGQYAETARCAGTIKADTRWPD